MATDGPLGSGAVSRETSSSPVLRFGIDVSIKQRARRLPAEADVLLRAGAGGEVVDSRTLSLERPNDSLLCG